MLKIEEISDKYPCFRTHFRTIIKWYNKERSDALISSYIIISINIVNISIYQYYKELIELKIIKFFAKLGVLPSP